MIRFSTGHMCVHPSGRVFLPNCTPPPHLSLSRKSREAIVPVKRCRPRIHPRRIHTLNNSSSRRIYPHEMEPYAFATHPFRNESGAHLADFIHLIPAKKVMWKKNSVLIVKNLPWRTSRRRTPSPRRKPWGPWRGSGWPGRPCRRRRRKQRREQPF